MEPKLKPLLKRDYGKAIQFAITGMNFRQYTDSPLLLKLYGRYFWYMELGRSSQIIAAYCGDALAGVLLADMKGEAKQKQPLRHRTYVKLVDLVQHLFFAGGVGPYDIANAKLYREFSAKTPPDGEICFLAADPAQTVRGIGTLLLEELERREPGKRIFLYTDSNCTWQFYEHRGFQRMGEEQISMEFSGKGEVPLACYLYSRICRTKAES